MVVVSGSDGDRPWASAGVGDDRPRDAVVDALDHAPPPEGEGGVMLWWDDGAEDKYSATRGKWEKVNAAGDIVQSGRWRRVFVEQVAEIAEADASYGTGGGLSGADLPSCDELSPHEIVAVASMVERYA